MPQRNAQAQWTGKLQNGNGTITLGSGAFQGQYSFSSRFEQGRGTNPEELIAAAHAACFSMALAHELEQAGFTPSKIATSAKVSIEKSDSGFKIPGVNLETEADVPDIDQQTFHKHAESAKKNCPVSKALSALQINLSAKLVSG